MKERPVPSLFREFSAPVRVVTQLSEADSVLLMGRDGDPFNRWDAGQQYALGILRQMVAEVSQGKSPEVPEAFIEAIRANLADPDLDPAFKALTLLLPGEKEIGQNIDVLLPRAIHEARKLLASQIGSSLQSELIETLERSASNEAYSPDARSAGRRALGNQVLAMLAATGESNAIDRVIEQNKSATNMTDRMAALNILTHLDIGERDEALDEFYDRWQGDSIMVTKWFSLQAASTRDDTLDRVRELLDHPAFKIDVPNHVYALPGGFAWNNQLCFHDGEGSAYRLLTDLILKLDGINPEVSADLCDAFSNWRKLDADGQGLARQELRRIKDHGKLSSNLFEIVGKIAG